MKQNWFATLMKAIWRALVFAARRKRNGPPSNTA